MIDGITKDRVMVLHPHIRNDVLVGIERLESKEKVRIRIVQGLRTFPEQDAIYAQGRTKPGKVVTKAKAGESFHNYGLAFDFCLLHTDGSISWSLHEDMDDDGTKDWMEVVKMFRSLGFKWGGDFGDSPHFEKAKGLTWSQCLALHNAGKVDGDGYIVI